MKDIKRMKKEELIEEIEKKQEEIMDLKKAQEKLAKYEAYEKFGDELMAVKQGLMNAGFNETEAFTLMMKLLELQPKITVADYRRPTRS